MADFCKLHVFDGHQFVIIAMEENREPVLAFFFRPPGLTTCRMTLNYDANAAGEKKRDQAFLDIDTKKAHEFYLTLKAMTPAVEPRA